MLFFTKCPVSSLKMTADLHNCNFRYLFKHNLLNKRRTDYEEAISKLNHLQSNVVNLKECTKKAEKGVLKRSQEETKIFLKRIGISLERIDKELSVIHVSGTKGKGSTCAYCESILRSHGFKTGFFSSPHLVAVRERIRINGEPISEDKFADHFWDVYRKLESNRNEYDGVMPFFFSFLTVMAISVFLSEKVDVAIFEVGIGGEQDSTNLFSSTPVVGITSLGLDHTKLLGETLDKIAWQKAGIMKPGSIAVISKEQPSEALKVIRERAKEKNCHLVEAPSIQEYTLSDYVNSSRIVKEAFKFSAVQELNISVALQLSHAWMAKCRNRGEISNIGKGFQLEEPTVAGLHSCFWPGRQQIVSRKNGAFTYYVDGAHTVESLQKCAAWFKEETRSRNCKKALLFNVTSDRDSLVLMSSLVDCQFDIVLFSTNVPRRGLSISSDQTNLVSSVKNQLTRCRDHENIWKSLTSERQTAKQISKFATVQDAVDSLESLKSETGKEEYCVLVTGSLHLVGAFFSTVDPALVFRSNRAFNS